MTNDPFRLPPGGVHVYWRDAIGGTAQTRERAFKAASIAELQGRVRLHVRRNRDGEIEYIAIGRCTE